MNTKFFMAKMKWVRVAGFTAISAGLLFLASCFDLSNQNPCDCAVNNAVANTPSFNKELGEKCDQHENNLNDAEKAEWQRQLAACTAGRSGN